LRIGQEAKHQAKCLRIKSRELADATAKRQKPREGLCVLNALSSAHQPNCRFNADKNAPHFCRLTWALGPPKVADLAVSQASIQERMNVCSEIEPTKVTEWVSIGIAMLAFGAAIWQAKESRKQAAITREHNKMSVMPILVSHEGWHNGPDELVVSLTIKNVGVGVALITDRFFTFEGKKFAPQRESTTVEELLELIFKRTLKYEIINSEFFGTSARIPPGASYTLAKILFPNPHPNLREVVEAMINKATFIVTYESVYKEPFTYNSAE
jgi:hypothetical protein